MDRPYRILIVEDSETQALKLQMTLESQGWETSVTKSSEAALEELNRVLPDLLMVDFHLPGMRGDELCRQVRMNVHTRNIPILMLTVEEAGESELHGLDSGADDYIPKSVDSDVLLVRIQSLLRKSQSDQSLLPAADAYLRQGRLLIVDDSRTYLEFLSTELRAEGYNIETAVDGPSALALVENNGFDCVLVDLVMPGMDGLEVCRSLSALRLTMAHPLVVLMLTAHESKEDMTKGLEAGADDFVGKSSDLGVIKARLRALLRRKFFEEENQRIVEELKNKELETVRARAEKEAAEARAALAEQLAQTNRELELANRKLKDAQVHLVQSEKMASLGQLVAGIAHEINNPLAFALNHLFTVQERVAKITQDPESTLSPAAVARLAKTSDRLAEMKDGLERVKELVLKLRTFSRLDEGEFKTVNIHDSIDSVLLFLRHRTKSRIRIGKEYCADGQLSCFAGQLNQVIMNVIANAVDAIQAEGVITVTTRREQDHFVIAVADTGIGIPEEMRHRIFEPFFTTKPIGQGTGLGLSISYGIVQAHRGVIDVESTPGRGTRVSLRIPLDLKEVLCDA